MKLCLLLLLFHPPVSAGPDEAEKVVLEVITDSSPCSTTCGLGIRTQTLCLLKDSKTALEEKVGRKNGTKVETFNIPIMFLFNGKDRKPFENNQSM